MGRSLLCRHIQHGPSARFDEKDDADEQCKRLHEEVVRHRKNNRTLHASTYGGGRSCARSRVRLFVEKRLISIRKVAPLDHTWRSSKFVLPQCRTDTDRDHQQSHNDIEYHALQTKRSFAVDSGGDLPFDLSRRYSCRASEGQRCVPEG